jgi:hypothetical protein
MDRAFASGASGSPPTAPVSPSVGYATAGNPGPGTPATKPGPWWYHMITEEQRAVVVAAGITPDQTNTTQLRDAILALIAAGAANDYKASVRVATTANIASLVGGAPDTVDGITLVLGNRVLVKDQSTGAQNGIYTVTTLGTGANGTWTRATDADTAGELNSGALVPVEEGTVSADTLWMLTTNDPITIGTTALVFARKDGGNAIATTGEAQTGTDNTKLITPLRMREGFNAAGTAPVYACRAWVNFNGTGTVAIRASGNVSSITDNGVGDYTINFTTAMQDTNYALVASGNSSSISDPPPTNSPVVAGQYTTKTTTSGRIINMYGPSSIAIDTQTICASVFR